MKRFQMQYTVRAVAVVVVIIVSANFTIKLLHMRRFMVYNQLVDRKLALIHIMSEKTLANILS